MSADMFLGVPYNISSYSLLTAIIAKMTKMIPRYFIHSFGDSHIYNNHIEQVNELLSRDYNKYPLPNLAMSFTDYGDVNNTIEAMSISDFELINYQSYPPIKAKLSTGLK